MTHWQFQAAGVLRPAPRGGGRHKVAAKAGLVCASVAAWMLTPDVAHAYVGPGAGLTAIGTVLALLTAVLFAIVGFVWFPIKRLLGRRTSRVAGGTDDLDDRGTGR